MPMRSDGRGRWRHGRGRAASASSRVSSRRGGARCQGWWRRRCQNAARCDDAGDAAAEAVDEDGERAAGRSRGAQSDKDQPLQRCASARIAPALAARRGRGLAGRREAPTAARMITEQTPICTSASVTRRAEIEVEPDGGIDRDLERLVGRPAAEQQHDGEAGEGEEEDDGARGRAACRGSPASR